MLEGNSCVWVRISISGKKRMVLTDRLSTVITRVFQYHREESPTHEFRESAADAAHTRYYACVE